MQSRMNVPRPNEFHPSPNEEDSLRGDICLIVFLKKITFPQIGRGAYYAG
jgi:hypothetical protein